jgi:hypothetical protein
MHISAVLGLAALVGLRAGGAGDAPEALLRLQQLQGDWHGTYEWTGARTSKGDLEASYHVTGLGSALIEELIMDHQSAMTSVYHLDHDDLRVTHFCAAKNQPRLKADAIDLGQNVYRFSMVDITNLSTLDAPHVHGLTIHLVDHDHLEIQFGMVGQGKESVEHITLTRIAT